MEFRAFIEIVGGLVLVTVTIGSENVKVNIVKHNLKVLFKALRVTLPRQKADTEAYVA